jgi:uncharacterized protein YecT (DUF1311 family)
MHELLQQYGLPAISHNDAPAQYLSIAPRVFLYGATSRSVKTQMKLLRRSRSGAGHVNRNSIVLRAMGSVFGTMIIAVGLVFSTTTNQATAQFLAGPDTKERSTQSAIANETAGAIKLLGLALDCPVPPITSYEHDGPKESTYRDLTTKQSTGDSNTLAIAGHTERRIHYMDPDDLNDVELEDRQFSYRANYKSFSGPSFNCAGSLTADEAAVCNSDELAALDRQLSGLYKLAYDGLDAAKQARLRGEQRIWLQRRSNCGASADCIGDAYRSRIPQLKSLGLDASSLVLQCSRNIACIDHVVKWHTNNPQLRRRASIPWGGTKEFCDKGCNGELVTERRSLSSMTLKLCDESAASDARIAIEALIRANAATAATQSPSNPSSPSAPKAQEKAPSGFLWDGR